MTKLNANVKEKPILSTFMIAIIIGLICLIIFILNYFQMQIELPPKLIATTQNGEETELLLLSYDWNYKGENKKYDSGIDVTTYNFNGKHTVYANCTDVIFESINVKTNPKYKIKAIWYDEYRYDEIYDEYTQVYDGISQINDTEFELSTYQTYVRVYTIVTENQGTAKYAIKCVETNPAEFDKLKEYKDIKIENTEAINKFITESPCGRYLNNINISNNVITCTYEYFIPEEVRKSIAIEMFVLFDSITDVNFEFLYNNYVKNEYDENNEYMKKELTKIEPINYNRDTFITYKGITIEELEIYINK